MKKATHQQTKLHNRDLVLRTIFDRRTVSRAEIARITGLTRTTVSDAAAALLRERLIEEVGFGSSLGGKNPILLSVVADSRYLIGLNLAQDKFIGSIVNLRGEIKETLELPVPNQNGEKALQLVYKILDQLLEKDWKPVVGIGVGTPGLVNTQAGVVVNAVNLDWRDLPLAQLLRDRYHHPVIILNDSQATTIGEYWFNEAQDSETNLVVVNLKYGIGAGILINGKLFQGDGGGAGEVGHIVVEEHGELCRCGKRGCLETVASVRAVLSRMQALNPEMNSFDQVVRAFLSGDSAANKVVIEAGKYLGNVLASLTSTLNIHRFILTGEMTRFGARWLEAVERSMKEGALSYIAEGTQLEMGKLDYRACILGASAFMLLDSYSLLFQRNEEN